MNRGKKKMADKSPFSSLSFEGNVQANWTKWRKRFENYIIANELNKKPESTQCAVLLH